MPRSDKPLSTLDVLNRVLDFDNSRLNVDLSELPAAAALSDTLTNPTTSLIGAALLVWDGTNWVRARMVSTTGADLTGTGLLAVHPQVYRAASTFSPQKSIRGLGDGETTGADGVLAVSLVDFNNTSIDRRRNNYEVTLLASAARTASTNSADQTNFNARGIMVWLNITAVPGTDNISLKVVGKDPVSGGTTSLLTSATFTTTGIRTFVVYPGAGTTASADVTAAAQFPLPRTWRIEIVHSASSSFTYSVGACYIN